MKVKEEEKKGQNIIGGKSLERKRKQNKKRRKGQNIIGRKSGKRRERKVENEKRKS